MTIAIKQRQHALIALDKLSSSDLSTKEAKLQKPATRSVRFNQTVDYRSCLHVNDYTDDEYDTAWYSKQEYAEMKREIAITLRIIKAGLILPDGLTFRGLEYRTKEGSLARKENKAHGLIAVLEEQDRQRSMGFSDDELISRAFMAQSQPCTLAAQRRGKLDATEVVVGQSFTQGEAKKQQTKTSIKNKGKKLIDFFGNRRR
eukprot:CAMPEP_0202441098 /NCGR_PEP_ID=MMETSP1360-20130828/389_1 /ASSEMBLY_ACC=CAM_ASM_000848 /TAXON_ID=515479 /ORGANISM="Licmophora paradoxa, Strain CCMP2313" /LENGTH=201 /DNA_ID=CAMNT_0049055847 /DNA_START=36 /DNA_END=641 /DNA_ORIENTATION=+